RASSVDRPSPVRGFEAHARRPCQGALRASSSNTRQKNSRRTVRGRGETGGCSMKPRVVLAAVALVLRSTLALAQTTASAVDFTVGDIRVEGLQRVSEGTVYNYLPVNIGDHLSAQRVREAIRALYATGFFRDVQLRRDGTTLVVVVLERPSIESFEITGNKDIKTEDLQKSLRNVGLATGKTFDRSVL